MEHKETKIYCPWSDKEVAIDEGIAELIKELWRLDIRTSTCCQDASRGRKPDRDMWVDLECDSFPAFARVMKETVDINWHIAPRLLEENHLVISVSFPGKHYDRILSYFKNLEVGQ